MQETNISAKNDRNYKIWPDGWKSTRKKYLSHKSDLRIYGQRRLLGECDADQSCLCQTHLYSPKQPSGPQLPGNPKCSLGNSLVYFHDSYFFLIFFTLLRISRYPLLSHSDRETSEQTRSFRENRIQPISREFLLLKNEAQSSKDGTKSYFTIPYITISRHDHFERHKEVLPLFCFPAVSEVSSLLSQSPRLPLTLCCQPRSPPFHSILFPSGGAEWKPEWQ